MRGATFPGGREVALVDFPDPTPGPGEVVVEIKASGMCGSDLHFYRRPKGAPLAVRHHPLPGGDVDDRLAGLAWVDVAWSA